MQSLFSRDKLFYQNGNTVFKEVTGMVARHINFQIDRNMLDHRNIKRYWLHQANLKMNQKIIQMITGRKEFGSDMCPQILSEFGNTSSSGSVITFIKHNDINVGEYGILCSFGAGYSIGSVLLQRI